MNLKLSLVSKTVGTSFSKYKGDAIRLSKQTPASVDEVVLAVKEQPDLKRKVTTFRDSFGKVIERAFDYFDKPLKNKVYTRSDHVIGEKEFVTSTTIKDYLLDKNALEYYKELRQFPNVKRTALWTNTLTETSHLSENINTGEKVLSQVRSGIKNKNKTEHTFIEFPHIVKNKIEDKPQKFLQFTVKNKDASVIQKSIKSQGAVFPEDDSYIGYRALTIEDSKIQFAKKYIHERGLDDMEITINPEYNPINEKNPHFTALFCAEDGVIYFNKDSKVKSKAGLAGVSAHEAEHGWHYYLQGRLKGGDTPWQTRMAEKFGKLKDKELIKEAKIYNNAIENYVPFWENLEAYKKNKIEILANQKGFGERNNYIRESTTMNANFPHIPNELL